MIDEILFPETKRNPGGNRSIMNPTGDSLQYRITQRVKDRKDTLLIFPARRNLFEKDRKRL